MSEERHGSRYADKQARDAEAARAAEKQRKQQEEQERLQEAEDAKKYSRYADKQASEAEAAQMKKRQEEQERLKEAEDAKKYSRYAKNKASGMQKAQTVQEPEKEPETRAEAAPETEDGTEAGSKTEDGAETSPKPEEGSETSSKSEDGAEPMRDQEDEAKDTEMPEKPDAAVKEPEEPEDAAKEPEESGAAAKKPEESDAASKGPGESGPAANEPEQETKTENPVLAWISAHRKKTAIIAACTVAVILYSAVAVYFQTRFYDDTAVFGVDCSRKTVEEVKTEVAQKLEGYTLQISERQGTTETLDADDIDLAFRDDNSIDRMMQAQKSWLWPFMMGRDRSDMANVGFTYDRDTTAASVTALQCFQEDSVTKPEDAYLTVTEDGFRIVPEVMGNELDPELTLEAVCKALDNGAETLSLDEEDCYLTPDVYQDNEELVQERDAKNAVTQARITMDFGDEVYTVDAVRMDDWLIRLSDGSYVVDDMKVEDFVAELADTYDTFGLPHTFTTAYGTTLTLYDGDYGWQMNRGATALALMKAINDGVQGELEPEYYYSAKNKGSNDIGDTYVEICIQDQRMMLFVDGECIVDTPVVTGNPNRGNGTPTGGVWAIDAKMENYTLVGRGYRVPVSYWMPFNGNVGIHDLQSRYYFGSTIYLSNGSHGCVNTPLDAVRTIYENVSIGTPVIVYKSPNEP